MMTSQKFMSSLSTIPNESKLYTSYSKMNQSAADLRLPYKQTLPLKFPKRNIRKQTQMNMLKQTDQNPQKSCIRNYNHANRSRIFEEPAAKKPLAKRGMFHSLSRESLVFMPLNRSLEDFGAPNNRKKFVQARHIRPDPIVIGHAYTQHNSALEKVWAQPRRHRDNGKYCEQTLVWGTNKNKSYLERYRQKGARTKQQ